MFGKLLPLRELWKANFCVQSTDHLDECMGHHATYSCIVEAQVMLVLFSLLLHVIHHAFYEDFSA
jgi:hypothetical protein